MILWHFLAMAPPQKAGYCVRSLGQMRAQARLGARPIGVLGATYARATEGRLARSREWKAEFDGAEFALFRPRALRAPCAWVAQAISEAPLINRLGIYDALLARGHAPFLDFLACRLPAPDAIFVHSHAAATDYAFALARRFPGAPFVYDSHGLIEESLAVQRGEAYRETRQFRRIVEREGEALRRSRLVFAISGQVKSRLAARGAPAGAIHVIPNGFDASQFREAADPAAGRRKREAAGFRARWAIGTVSSCLAYEGLETIVRAVAALRARGVDAGALIAGDGPQLPALAALARELDIADYVTLPGRVPHAQAPEWYAALDVFAVPRLDFPVTRLVPPIKLVEALARGLAVVVSDLPVLREAVEGRHAEFFPAGGTEAFAAVCERLLLNDERRRELGARAREWAMAERTWDALCARQIAALREILPALE